MAEGEWGIDNDEVEITGIKHNAGSAHIADPAFLISNTLGTVARARVQSDALRGARTKNNIRLTQIGA